MNRPNKGISAVFPIILIVSLFFNMFLAVKYTDLAKRQNTMWSNAITNFSQVINLVSINTSYTVNDQSAWKHRLDEARTNLTLLQVGLNNVETLVYADRIFPWEQREKFRLFINYNFEVIRLTGDELAKVGAVSEESKERLKVIHKTWEEILRVLENERNKRDPFRPVFTTGLWSPVFSQAVAVFDGVELIPLPER